MLRHVIKLIYQDHHDFLVLWFLTNMRITALAQTQNRRNSISGSPSECYFKYSVQYQSSRGDSTPVSGDGDYTPAFLSPRWKFGKIEEPLLKPSELSSPNRNIFHKEALRRVALNRNILLWLQICPSHNSLHVRLVSVFINISKLGNNTH